MKTFISRTLIKAGEKILSFYGKSSVMYHKQTVIDIVTEADLASNAIITDAIKAAYPEHGIISEEGEGYLPGSDYQWYIDPLDGTKNFESSTPLFGINIALAYKNEVTHAAIYLPLLKDFCYAEKGKGSFHNGVKTTCSSKENWKGTYGLGTMKLSSEHESLLNGINELTENTGWTNAIASSAVAGIWVSTGKRDWYVGPSSNSWDYAPTSLIASEAGAIVTNIEGMPYSPGDRGIVVANKFLHPQLIALIKKSYKK